MPPTLRPCGEWGIALKNNQNHQKTPDQKGRFLFKWSSMGARGRILLYFLSFTVIMLVMIWLFQIVFLDDFYKVQTYHTLKTTSSTLEKNLNNQNLNSLTERFAEENGLCIVIVDENFNLVAEGEGLNTCLLHHMDRRELRRYISASNGYEGIQYFSFPMRAFRNDHYDERKFVGPVPRQNRRDPFSLISVHKAALENGKNVYILLNAIMTPLSGTVSTIRNEFGFISILLLVISVVASWLLSRRITRPIVEITEASALLRERQYLPIAHPDYREVQELDDRLQETAKELQKVEGMQKELISNISHDLRTPLTLIQGYAEMMRDIPSEGTAENMQTIVDEANRLSTLVEAVLDLNSIRQSPEKSEASCFPASDCIRPMAERYNKLLESKGYRVLYEADEDVLIETDPVRFQQVLQNLINNAITYTGKDKTVTIRQSRRDQTVRFDVIDTGEGIAEEDLPYIWERYYRGNKPHKRAAVGSGLGLNIVRNILNASGQSYGVESKPGKGSDFWFEAPVANGKNTCSRSQNEIEEKSEKPSPSS